MSRCNDNGSHGKSAPNPRTRWREILERKKLAKIEGVVSELEWEIKRREVAGSDFSDSLRS